MANRFLNNITINDEYTLPNADGTADQIITTDGSGQLSFVDQNTINAGNAEHVVIYAKNTSGASISKGTPVYITGTVGATDTVQIAPADASNSAKMPAVGLLDATLAVNAFGYVITGGFMDNITTDPIDGATPASNDTVYVKVGGGLTLTKPTGPTGLIQNVAKVGKVSGGNAGSLIVSSILRTNDVPNLTTGKIWVGDGNTVESTVVHLDETNGRMGIGATSPSEKLEVDGNIKLTGNLNVGGYISPNDEGGNLSIFGGNDTTNDAQILLHGSSNYWGSLELNYGYDAVNSFFKISQGANEHLRITNGGKVGIGTTSPSQKLTVEGNIELGTGGYIYGDTTTPSLRLSNAAGAVLRYGTSQLQNGGSLQFVTATGTEFRINGTGGGYVTGSFGIGTTAPSEKLEVAGDIASQGIYVDRTHESGGISNPFAKFGLHYWWGDSNSINLQKTGNNNKYVFSTQSGYFHVVNASGNDVRITSSDQTVEVGSGILNLGVAQHSAANNNNGRYISISNAGNTSGSRGVVNVNGDFRINDYSTSAEIEKIKLKNDGSAYFTGNVGIGTTSPSQLLHIDLGTVDVKAQLNAIGGFDGMLVDGTNASYNLIGGNGDKYTLGALNDGSFRIYNEGGAGYALTLNNSGKLGIGTTNPQEKLDISAGSIRLDDGLSIKWGTIDANRGRVRITGNEANDFLQFVTDNSEKMRLTNTGLGIGTTAPLSKFQVDGQASLLGNGFYGLTYLKGTNALASYDTANKIVMSSNGSTDGLYTGGLHLTRRALTQQGHFGSGIRGISTGTVLQDNALELYTSTNTEQNATRLKITSTGNVGIGTTSPSEKLEVSGGNIKGDGLIQVENSSDNNIIGKLVIDYGSGNNPRLSSVGGLEIDVNTDLVIRNNKGLYSDTSSSTGLIIGSQRANTPIKFLTSPTTNLTYSEAMRIAGDGNVGIGTTSPSEKLEVNGGNLIVNDGTSKSRLRPTDLYMQQGGIIKAWLRADGNSYLNGGNVGIGTTNPNSILHIADANPEFILEDTTNINRCRLQNVDGNFRYEADYNSQMGNSRHLFFIDGSEKFRINTDGNVGIGTTSPTQKLDVAGSIRTNSNLYVYNSDLSRQALRVFAEATTNTGILKLSNGSNWGLLMRGESNNPSIGSYYSGTLNITGFEDSTGTTTSAIKLAQFVFGGTGGGSGYLTLNGDLRVNTNKKIRFGYGNSQENGIEWVSGSKISAAITPVDTANYSRTGLGFFTGDFSDGTTDAVERMRITRTGNVGIGTTSPSEKLEVAGKAIIRRTGTATAHGDTDFLVTDATAAGSTAQIQILGGNAGNSHLYFSDPDSYSQGAIQYLHASDSMNIRVNAATAMTINSSRNVGIGTTSPSQKLDVSGNINLGGDNRHIYFGGNNTFIGERSNSTELELRGGGNSSAQTVYIDNTGQIGVGTASPGQKLDVDGNILADGLGIGNNTIYSNSVNLNNAGSLRIGNAEFISKSSNDMSIFQSKMVVTSGGNVGIGTTSPAAKLQILDNAEQPQLRVGTDASNYLDIKAGSASTSFTATGSGFVSPDINFNTNGTKLSIKGLTGFVGIGSGTPSEMLEVFGNVQAETLIATDLTDGYVPWNRNGTLGLQDSEIYQDNGQVGIGTTTLSQALNVDGDILADGYRVTGMQTAPSGKGDTGTLGEIRITQNYIYVCYATNSWSRVALETSW